MNVSGACVFLPGSAVSCSDKVRNGNEAGVDCGGPQCAACAQEWTVLGMPVVTVCVVGALASAVVAASLAVVVAVVRRRWTSHQPVKITKHNVVARRSSEGDEIDVVGSDVPQLRFSKQRSTPALPQSFRNRSISYGVESSKLFGYFSVVVRTLSVSCLP